MPASIDIFHLHYKIGHVHVHMYRVLRSVAAISGGRNIYVT